MPRMVRTSRRSLYTRGSADKGRRIHCVACKGHKDVVGKLSNRGICADCALCHQMAQWLGLTHVYYTIESINDGVKLSYTGPVIKAA